MWVFNPHIHDDGVLHETIASEGQIDGMVAQIREQVDAARDKGNSTRAVDT